MPPILSYLMQPLASLFSGLTNIGLNAASNTANKEINEQNIALAREINSQQMSLQRETNAQNLNLPTTEYNQLRGLGASRAAALGSLGAPASAGTPTLNVPQGTQPMHAATVDLNTMLEQFSAKSQAEVRNLDADTSKKEEEQHSIVLDNLRKQMGVDAYNDVSKVVNDYLSYIESNDVPSYKNFIDYLSPEQKSIIDKSGDASQLAQELISKAADDRKRSSDVSNVEASTELTNVRKLIEDINLSYHESKTKENINLIKQQIKNLSQDEKINAVEEMFSTLKTEWLKDHSDKALEMIERYFDIKHTDLGIQQNEWIRILDNIFGKGFAGTLASQGAKAGLKLLLHM